MRLGMTPSLRMRMTLNCRQCRCAIDSAHKRQVEITIGLFGMKDAWRLCQCGESVLGIARVRIRDRRGVWRYVRRRLILDPLDEHTRPQWVR